MEVRMSGPLFVSCETLGASWEAPAKSSTDTAGTSDCFDTVDASWCMLGEPAFLALQRLGRYPRTARRPCNLGAAELAGELLRREKPSGSAASRADRAVQEAWAWAQREQYARRFGSLSADELASLRLCLNAPPRGATASSASTCPSSGAGARSLLPHLQDETLLAPLNRFLASLHPGRTPSESRAPPPQGESAEGAESSARLWEALLGDVMGSLTSLRLSQQVQNVPQCCYRLAWIPQQIWDKVFSRFMEEAACENQLLCFTGFQSVVASEPWQCLELLIQGCVPCLLEFDESIASQAVNVQAIASDAAATAVSGSVQAEQMADHDKSVEMLLPPFLRGSVTSIRAEEAPAPYRLQIFRVRIAGLRVIEALNELLDAPADAILAGSLLLGLQAGSREEVSDIVRSSTEGNHEQQVQEDFEEPDAASCCTQALLAIAADCFRALADAVQVRNPGTVDTVWKGYLECALDGSNPWKELGETLRLGIFGFARTAMTGSVRASLRVTKRALGFRSCKNYRAMDEEYMRQVHELDELRGEAVECAREQVAALGLETLTDPEAFLRFVQHDPIRAFKAVPAILFVYTAAAGPAQRVLLFAKLMGLTALAAGMLQGDEKVLAAFCSPLPLSGNPWQRLLLLTDLGLRVPRRLPSLQQWNFEEPDWPGVQRVDESKAGDRTPAEAAERLLGLLQLQRLHLARVRLLVLGGAPDAGKTTMLREVFGLRHLKAGLSEEGRTNEVRFELHPAGDSRFRPAYLVDTPGFGDGEQLHRNDMGRLILSAGCWLPGVVRGLWVLRAGRHTRHDSHNFVLAMSESARAAPLVLVTHVDKLFEERYREAGPRWRDGLLQGVSHRDPRWRAQRQVLMQELRSEVDATISSALQLDGEARQQAPEVVYACLGGWMAREASEEEDEFAEPAPWPWAKEELSEFFGILGAKELRKWLDSRIGL
eukprot:TRINITY_DN29557_c0_g1_i1.p1 TRINITY_DN29557_c0_g1~~TRINITY_DN29557_c0_g1_i1.p1  ORF type:complete len:943 (+),score=225.30 TRINITY_DN29557_c0_g1_i1:65-2893(+)